MHPASRATDTGYPPAMLPSGATSPGRASALQAGAVPAFPEKSPCDPRGGQQLRKHGTWHLSLTPEAMLAEGTRLSDLPLTCVAQSRARVTRG